MEFWEGLRHPKRVVSGSHMTGEERWSRGVRCPGPHWDFEGRSLKCSVFPTVKGNTRREGPPSRLVRWKVSEWPYTRPRRGQSRCAGDCPALGCGLSLYFFGDRGQVGCWEYRPSLYTKTQRRLLFCRIYIIFPVWLMKKEGGHFSFPFFFCQDKFPPSKSLSKFL